MRIVVIGGNGNFGARICRALLSDKEMQVLAAGRNAQRAPLDPRIRDAQMDLSSPVFPAALRELEPDVVIHCAGPFQGQDYRVAFAAIEAGAHYIDLADGREFVARFSEHVDLAARAANVLAVSGASSVPALSSAVVDALSGRIATLEEIQVVIAPAQRAPRGAATIASVFSYAGNPFTWLQDGAWTTVRGWQSLRRIRIPDLGARWAAACDVPDLALFPSRYPGVKTVTFRAALEIGVEHFGLYAAGALRSVGVPLPIERWAGPLDRLASLLDGFGTERGGMLVSVAGTKSDGRRARVDWHVIAGDNHGPEIPCMASILLARKFKNGELRARGALPCLGLLSLADFQPEFARWGMTTDVQEYVL